MAELIDREAAIKEIENEFAEFITSHGYDSYEKANIFFQWYCDGMMKAIGILLDMEAEQPTVEPLTDKEQRIFLAAMGREEEVCKEVDSRYVREPYEDSLMQVCKEIRRKVKGALWT